MVTGIWHVFCNTLHLYLLTIEIVNLQRSKELLIPTGKVKYSIGFIFGERGVSVMKNELIFLWEVTQDSDTGTMGCLAGVVSHLPFSFCSMFSSIYLTVSFAAIWYFGIKQFGSFTVCCFLHHLHQFITDSTFSVFFRASWGLFWMHSYVLMSSNTFTFILAVK